METIGGDASWTIVPGLLDNRSCAISGGAGKDISFEIEIAKRTGCRLAIFDPSPTGQQTFKACVRFESDSVKYFPHALSGRTGDFNLDEPALLSEGSYRAVIGNRPPSFQCLGLSPEDALKMAEFDSCQLLKLDIEGCEYEFIEALARSEIRPKQIAVEFHHFLPNIPMWRTLASMLRLKRAGYSLVYKRQCDMLFILDSVRKNLRR